MLRAKGGEPLPISLVRCEPVPLAWPWLLILAAWLPWLVGQAAGISLRPEDPSAYAMSHPIPIVWLVGFGCSLAGLVLARRHVNGLAFLLCMLAIPLYLGSVQQQLRRRLP